MGKKVHGRPRTVFLDWLLKTLLVTKILRCSPRTDQDGVNEDGNVPYGRTL